MAQINTPTTAAVTAVLLLGIGGCATADDLGSSATLDPQADALLQKMSDYMGGLTSFSADIHVLDEEIMGDGFKLSQLRWGSVKAQRPNKFLIARHGAALDQEIFFNGSTLAVYNKLAGSFVEVPAAGDADEGLEAATEIFGAELPARDLLGADSYTPLIEPVEDSAYLDAVQMGGVTCRHLAFRTDEVDWQLWVEEGDRPLPCRYTITTKWVYGAPQYAVTFSNWGVNPDLPAGGFEFTAPAGTKSMTEEEFRTSLKRTGSE
jgi:hypothetical protein